MVFQIIYGMACPLIFLAHGTYFITLPLPIALRRLLRSARGAAYASGSATRDQLKLQHKFTHRELHYSELNRFKSDFAKIVVDWYFGATDAIFKCTVVPGGIFDLQRFRGNMKFISAEEMSYNVIYKNAINFHSTEAEKAETKVLIVDRKDKARPDEFQRFLMENIPNVADIQEAHSENHNLLQVVDLLAGCVNGDLNGVQKFAKRTVVDHVKARLNIAHFRERNAYTKEKFRVNFWKSSAQKQRSPTSA